MTPPPLFQHQEDDARFCVANDFVFNASDPGTGRTRTTIEAIKRTGCRAIVVAPKSILRASWANDIERFAPNLSYTVLDAEGRKGWRSPQGDVLLTNHDAAKWLFESKQKLYGHDMLILDESTAFKHHTAQRTKAMLNLSLHFPRRILLSGTPMPNGPLDLWAQMAICDGGQRLGNSYFRFRHAVCEPKGFGNFVKWEPREGITDALFGLVGDIMIRRKLEDCLDMPETSMHTVAFDPPANLMRAYEEMRKHALLELDSGEVTALNAAAKLGKLLQIASGAVYDGAGGHADLSPARYELIMDLCEARKQTLVAFCWRHQREGLELEAKKRGISLAYIDGSVNADQRYELVEKFQAGNIKVLACHPASAGHGLTLTAATTTIWASPTYNLEHFLQFNRRAYRAGQTKKTEVIMVSASGTVEPIAYAKLQEKDAVQGSFLEMFDILRSDDAKRRAA